jgi:Holliday junction resolvase-like predicted endonuclease
MNDKGQWAEKIAGEYLEKSGYFPLFFNFSWRFGEMI